MAITVPYSLDLGPHDDAKDAAEGSVPDTVPQHMKIYLGANVDPTRMQSVVGSLQAVYRYMMSEDFKSNIGAATRAGYAPWESASAMDVTMESGVTGITDDHVAIIVSGNFDQGGRTHFYTETFNQLVNVLLEKTKDN